VIYHASFTDTETLDLLEQHKRSTSSLLTGWLINTAITSEWGLTPEVTKMATTGSRRRSRR
jgi:hypothetical protein